MRVTAPAGIHFLAVTPQFTVPDIGRTVAYYRDVLGLMLAFAEDTSGRAVR
jgi:hypothetical protein